MVKMSPFSIQRRIGLIRDVKLGFDQSDVWKLIRRSLVHQLPFRLVKRFGLERMGLGAKFKLDGYALRQYDNPHFVRKEYESEIAHWFDVHGGTFIDGGANIGRYTILHAKQFDHVLSLEPNPPVYDVLVGNINLNRLWNVIPSCSALSDKTGVGDLSVSDSNSGISSMTHDVPNGRKIMVRTLRLDQLNLKNVRLVKLDVEGGEFKAIMGMRKMLERCMPRLIVEIQSEKSQLPGFLVGLGYKFKERRGDNCLFEEC
jgi:FkbM family methyltransferase